MKTRFRIWAAAALFALGVHQYVYGQEVTVRLQLPPEGRFTTSDIFQMVHLINSGLGAQEVFLRATVVNGGENKLIFEGETTVFQVMPGLVVVGPDQVESLHVLHSDPAYERLLFQTGSVPAGTYIICVDVLEAETGELLTRACVLHEVLHPSPPQLLMPANEARLFEEFPSFSWLPPMPVPVELDLRYRLKVVEVLDGQNPYEAMESNPAWYLEEEVFSPLMVYPMDARELESGTVYAWQVQAMGGNGVPVGENEGKSAIFIFRREAAYEHYIRVLSPVSPCAGVIGADGFVQEADLNVEWEYMGDFQEFRVIVYNNPCGLYPGPTPTPGPVPTPSPAPTTSPPPPGPVPAPVPVPVPVPPPPVPTPSPVPQPTPTPVPRPVPVPVPLPVPSPDGPADQPKPEEPKPDTPKPGPVITPSPPPSPDTPMPTPVPRPPVQPGDDWDEPDDGLPPLPPGWEWGPEGARWAGNPPPDPLPPGWEMGPWGPVWVGEGSPPARKIVGISESIRPLPGNIGRSEPVFESATVNLASMRNPGQALIYQVYGVIENPDGRLTGVLTDPVCLRYMPLNQAGDLPEPESCHKEGCTLSYSWVRKTPIRVVKPISSFPSGDDLKSLIPGACIAFSVEATDVDLLKQVCMGKNDCMEQDTSIKRIGPIEHGVRYVWEKTGDGELLFSNGNTILYQLPRDIAKNKPKKATIKCTIANVGGKAADEPIDGKIIITAQFVDSCQCVDVSISMEQPQMKKYDDDFEEKQSQLCVPVDPVWEKGPDISGSLIVQQTICPEAMTLLRANHSDNDDLTLKCKAEACGEDVEILHEDDPLHIVWNDSGAGGYFPLGNSGPVVLYIAPPKETNATLRAKIRDSGTLFNDPDKDENSGVEVKKLLNLKEINVEGSAKYKNITAGYAHHFKPVWEPGSAKVKKIVWELDLGGKTGRVKRVFCDPDGMTREEATLKFTTRDSEKDLEVSWKKHSHTHGTKILKCEIFGEADPCIDCCVCRDTVWEKSDFMGRDTLDWNEFHLFFEKGDNKDDGKVANLTTVNPEDQFGEITSLHGRNAGNWFVHWSKKTYGTCVYDHQSSDPKLLYKKGATWLGLYETNGEQISLSDKSADQTDRDPWQAGRTEWIRSSSMTWIDPAQIPGQPGFDLRGHNLCNKVYLHEYGHYISMTKYWRAGETWATAYGIRSENDSEVRRLTISASNALRVTLKKTGNYAVNPAHGNDCLQKYNIRIVIYTSSGSRRDSSVITVGNGWFRNSVEIQWSGPEGTQTGLLTGNNFEIVTVTKRYRCRGLELTEYDRANDPDKDYVPNQVEDRLGLDWNNRRTHADHARGNLISHIGAPQVPDQEFWADRYAFDHWDQVEPGKPALDWANPGSQTDPEFKK